LGLNGVKIETLITEWLICRIYNWLTCICLQAKVALKKCKSRQFFIAGWFLRVENAARAAETSWTGLEVAVPTQSVRQVAVIICKMQEQAHLPRYQNRDLGHPQSMG
jgi:hypothetical protein